MGKEIIFHDKDTYYFVLVPKSFFHNKVFVTKSQEPFPMHSTPIEVLSITTIPWWYTMPDYCHMIRIKLKRYLVKKRHNRQKSAIKTNSGRIKRLERKLQDYNLEKQLVNIINNELSEMENISDAFMKFESSASQTEQISEESDQIPTQNELACQWCGALRSAHSSTQRDSPQASSDKPL